MFQHLSNQFQADTVNIATSHIYVAGGSQTDSERLIEVGGAYTVAAESLPEAACYVALGHLHRPKPLNVPKRLPAILALHLHTAFSEAGYAKSVTIVDAKPNETASWKEVFLSSGKPLMKWKATEGLSQVHSWLDEKRIFKPGLI